MPAPQFRARLFYCAAEAGFGTRVDDAYFIVIQRRQHILRVGNVVRIQFGDEITGRISRFPRQTFDRVLCLVPGHQPAVE